MEIVEFHITILSKKGNSTYTLVRSGWQSILKAARDDGEGHPCKEHRRVQAVTREGTALVGPLGDAASTGNWQNHKEKLIKVMKLMKGWSSK